MQNEFIFSDNWCDIVFEKRNRAYGACLIRKHEPANILKGWLTAIFFFAALFAISAYITNLHIAPPVKIGHELPPVIYDINNPPPVVPPQPPQPPKPVSSSGIGIPIAVDSTNAAEQDSAVAIDSHATGNNGPASNDTSASNPIDQGGGTPTDLNTGPYLLAGVQERPQFPGGEEALMEYLQNNLKYPWEYLHKGYSAKVYVQFVIDTAGRVTQIKTACREKDYPLFESAANNVVAKMHLWSPGKQNGRKVPVLFSLPVNFASK